MNQYPSVSVCLPAYNEEQTVGSVIEQAHSLLSSLHLEYEILVCNDGSQDQTGEIISSLANRIPHLRTLNHIDNLGIHKTLEHLYGEAACDFVFINSCDGQWDMGVLLDLLNMTNRWDIVVASRKNKPYGLFRKITSWTFNKVPVLFFGVETYDAGAAKLIKREIITRYKLVSRSPFSEAERLIRAAWDGYRITHFPVSVSPRVAGRSHAINLKVLFLACRDVSALWSDVRRNGKFRENPARQRE